MIVRHSNIVDDISFGHLFSIYAVEDPLKTIEDILRIPNSDLLISG